MCKRPISLKNPSIAWNILNDSVFIKVPCGHCSDCENKKRFDWQVRVYYEYLRCKDLGGFTLFMNLTYDDEHLPVAYVDPSQRARVTARHKKQYIGKLSQIHNKEIQVIETDEIEDDLVMSCFNDKDIQDFTENCKDAFRRRGEHMAYMITSEYGHYDPYVDHHGREVVGTSRPHYHCLLFFDGNVTTKVARQVLGEHWTIGKFEFSDREGSITSDHGVVTDAGAIGYVCKYIQKSRDNAEALRKHLCLTDAAMPADIKRLNRKFAPFHRQSYGLGLYLLEVTDPALLAKGKTKLPMYSEDRKSVVMSVVDLPQYIHRKLFCFPQKETPNRSYILNPAGVELQAQKLLEQRQNLVDEIDDFLKNTNQYINPELLRHINHMLGRKSDNPKYYLRAKDFADDVKKSLHEFSVQSLVDYALIFQGLSDYNKTHLAPGVAQNGHYVLIDQIYKLGRIDDASFLDFCRYKYTKDRSIPQKVFNGLESVVVHIPELDRALYLYGLYRNSLLECGEKSIQQTIQNQNKAVLYYFKSLVS